MSYLDVDKFIEPSLEDFEDIEAGGSRGRERLNIGVYRDRLVQIYFPSKNGDPKKARFLVGKVGRMKRSNRESPGTDIRDFSIYFKEALERPELIMNSYLYLEKKEDFAQRIYIPNILSRKARFVLMEDDEKELKKADRD